MSRSCYVSYWDAFGLSSVLYQEQNTTLIWFCAQFQSVEKEWSNYNRDLENLSPVTTDCLQNFSCAAKKILLKRSVAELAAAIFSIPKH